MIEAFFKQKGDRNQAAFLVLSPLGQKAHKFNQKNNNSVCVYACACACVCACVLILFTHSSVSGHLRCLHVLAIINSVCMNIEVYVFFKLDSSPDICLGWDCWIIWSLYF